MSASLVGKKQCITCSKSGGIMICDGCQQPFCGKHSVEHRQELTNQLDGIMQEHDLLQQELGQSSIDNSLLKQINIWEKESITKIQVTAEAARADLQQIFDGSKEQTSKACHDIADNLRSSRDADDFSEDDLNRWMEQLNELKLEITSPPSIKLVEDKHSPIHLIKIKQSSFKSKKPEKSKQTSVLKTPALSVAQETFSQVFSGATLYEEGSVAQHTDPHLEYVHILGERLYSQGRHVIRFKIEYGEAVYNIFFGCISSRVTNNEIRYGSSASTGWFGYNEVYQNGIVDRRSHYDSNEIKTNDTLSLTFDCEKHQIELYHERKNKTYKLQIDIEKAPFPWRLLVVLYHFNDCVRILPNY
jgi:hypothetical protein